MVDLRSKFKKSLKELDFIDKKPASYINSNEDLTYYFNSFSKNLVSLKTRKNNIIYSL